MYYIFELDLLLLLLLSLPNWRFRSFSKIETKFSTFAPTSRTWIERSRTRTSSTSSLFEPSRLAEWVFAHSTSKAYWKRALTMSCCHYSALFVEVVAVAAEMERVWCPLLTL